MVASMQHLRTVLGLRWTNAGQLVVLVLLLVAACCRGTTQHVYNGTRVTPSWYLVNDGVMWSGANGVPRNLSSFRSTILGRSGYVFNKSGPLTDTVYGDDSSSPDAWLTWKGDVLAAEATIQFTFKENISLCQVDVHARSTNLSYTKIKIAYAGMKYVWGFIQKYEDRNTSAVLAIPRSLHAEKMNTSRQVNLQVDLGLVQQLDISEVTFWTCACEYTVPCKVKTSSGVPPPCDNDHIPRATCPGDSSATCSNNYCGDSLNSSCRADFLAADGLLVNCTLPVTTPTNLPQTQTEQPVKPETSSSSSSSSLPSSSGGTVAVQSNSNKRVIYLGVIGGLVVVAITVIILLIVRCYHYRKTKKQLEITTATIMAEGKYSAATLSRHFIDYNMASLSNGQLNTSYSSGSQCSTLNEVPAHYKMPRSTSSGTAVSVDQYKSPNHLAVNSHGGFMTKAEEACAEDTDEYVPMTGKAGRQPQEQSMANPYENIELQSPVGVSGVSDTLSSQRSCFTTGSQIPRTYQNVEECSTKATSSDSDTSSSGKSDTVATFQISARAEKKEEDEKKEVDIVRRLEF